MASRTGFTVQGTDGSDYSHRETIVQQYYVSAVNKSRLKWSLFFHCSAAALLLLKVGPHLGQAAGMRIAYFQGLQLPKPLVWEWIWLLGTLPALYLGVSACKKSNLTLLRNFVGCIVILGLAPLLYGLLFFVPDLTQFFISGKVTNAMMWKGSSLVVAWFAFFSLGLLVHGLQLYLAWVLSHAWAAKPKKS